MRISYHVFWLPKSGNSEEEYEDAFAMGGQNPIETPSQDQDHQGQDFQVFRCAVADGATETSFSGRWAKMLCRRYCEQATPSEASLEPFFTDSLPDLQERWKEHINARPLPWFAEEKARQGAFSTLLGLTVWENRDMSDLHYRVVAVGDSCLFHVRDDGLKMAFPLERSDDFNSTPYLIGSTQIWNEDLAPKHCHPFLGKCVFGDVFFLMTDALAAWFLRLRELENDNSIVRLLNDVKNQDAFERLVNDARDSAIQDAPRLRNDDVTFVRIQIQASSQIVKASSSPDREPKSFLGSNSAL